MMKFNYFLIPFFIFLYSCSETKRNLPNTLQKASDFRHSKEFDSAIFHSKKVRIEAKNPNNIAFANEVIGYSFFFKKNLDSSFHYYTEALKYSKKADSTDYYLQLNTYNMLGVIFEKFENHRRAIYYFKEALKLLDQYEQPIITNIYYNMAYNQSQMNDIKCIETYYEALKYSTKYNNQKLESFILNDLALVMLDTKNYDAAREYYIGSLETEYTQLNTKMQGFAYQGIGETYFHQNEYDSSKLNLDKALKTQLSLNNKKSVFSAYFYLGKLSSKFHQYKEAENYLGKAIEYLPHADITRKNIKVHKELSNVHIAMDRHDLARIDNENYYKEVDRYLDFKELASKIAKQDQFDTDISTKAAEFKKNSELVHKKSNWPLLLVLPPYLEEKHHEVAHAPDSSPRPPSNTPVDKAS